MLLALDTSTRRIGIALYDGIQVVTEMVWVSQFHHTVQLAPSVNRALEKADISIHELTAIGVALGPGSFTSLRTGLALAKGIALARHLPLIGIPSLDILVASQPISDFPMAAVLEAGRRRLAIGWYDSIDGKWIPTGKMEILTPQGLASLIHQPTIICGELDLDARTIIKRKWKNAIIASPSQSLRRPGFLGEIAWDRWQSGEVDNPETLAPIYLSQDKLFS